MNAEHSNWPLILEIKGNSLDDGPGIRTVVFFKGCPLSCAWCHNPESRLPVQELSYDPKLCIGCDTCIDTCPEKAISRKNPYFVDRQACTLCRQCVQECPSGALSVVGRRMSAEEVVDAILPDQPFFATSGGGVTLSGGEPAMYMGFTGELAGQLHNHGIHVLLETCGYFRLDGFMELLYPHLDTIYYDIKLYHARLHAQYCGVDNRVILENFRYLHHRTGRDGIILLPRVPLVPGITATEENLRAIAQFLKEEDVPRVQLLPFNPLWPEKELKVGRPSDFGEETQHASFMPPEEIERCEEIFSSMNITPVREAP